MFPYENLKVYQRAKAYNYGMEDYLLAHPSMHKARQNQLIRASFSIMLNIAEGASRFTKPSQRNYYVIARGSAFECSAIYDYLSGKEAFENKFTQELYDECSEISRMLYGMIKGVE